MTAAQPTAVKRVALITGASRGLGAALAGFLASQEFDLVLTARGAEQLEATGQALAARGERVVMLAGDVADAAHRNRLVAACERLGRLDLLVNNASELGPSPLPGLTDHPVDSLRRIFEVNVIAPIVLIQEALPLLAESAGLVVNVSSDAARGGYPGWGGYGASKAALDLATRTMAAELEGRDVGVVSVDPGDMRTAMHQAAFPDEDISDRPLPEATIPFWAWLLGQERGAVNGRRYEAQGERWETAA